MQVNSHRLQALHAYTYDINIHAILIFMLY